MPSSRESQLEVQSSASLVGYFLRLDELWLIGVLSLQETPRVQNPTILVRAGGGVLGEVKVTTYKLFRSAQQQLRAQRQ